MSDLPAETPQWSIAADLLRAMADKIDMNAKNGFAGAAVIIPPSGNCISSLILDKNADLALFWSSIQTRLQIALAEIEEANRQGQAFGRR